MQWCCFQPVMITSNNRSGFCVLSLMDLINHGVTSSITPFKVDSCQCWTISIKLLGAGGWLRQLIKISPRLINSIAAVRCVCYVTADFISLLVRWISFFFYDWCCWWLFFSIIKMVLWEWWLGATMVASLWAVCGRMGIPKTNWWRQRGPTITHPLPTNLNGHHFPFSSSQLQWWLKCHFHVLAGTRFGRCGKYRSNLTGD